jgi:hypothetical protein
MPGKYKFSFIFLFRFILRLESVQNEIANKQPKEHIKFTLWELPGQMSSPVVLSSVKTLSEHLRNIGALSKMALGYATECQDEIINHKKDSCL